jgi:hypothetical protein
MDVPSSTLSAMTPEPDNDPELERQRADIETAFRVRWLPLDVTKPRILTEHVHAEAHRFIDRGDGTWLDEAVIQAVRDGKQPGDTLRAPACSGLGGLCPGMRQVVWGRTVHERGHAAMIM